MNKKFLCILMCLFMMLVPFLTACSDSGEKETGEEADVATEEKRLPMTLSFWIPTSENTTEEAIDQVEAALNDLLAAKYNTHIEFNAIPEDEYADVVDKKLTTIDEVKTAQSEAAESERLQMIEDAENGIIREENTDKPDADEPVEGETAKDTSETLVDEYGQPIVVYPEVSDDQLDIFLVKGYEKFNQYREDGLIKNLDEDMTSVGYKIYSTVYPTFFDLARVNRSLYAIPNNHALGEYQLLLVNKELVEKYDYAPEELTTLLDCESFIVDIANQKLPGVTPLLGECEAPNMVYFSSDGQWSIIGSQIKGGVSSTSSVMPQISLSTDFTKTFGMMKRLKEKGAIGDGVIDEGEKFAVGVVKGDASLFDKYAEDYYVSIHGVPFADVDDVFESAFCISKYSKDSKRAMEVITYLNTDETFRTILQYGVEGVHWRLDNSGDEETIKIISDEYVMNIVDTGNVYLTYPAEGVGKSYWKYSMKQNQDSSANPYVGLDYINDDNRKIFQNISRLSAECIKALEDATAAEYDSVVAKYTSQFMQNKSYSIFMSDTPDPNAGVKETLINTYDLYLKTKS